MTPLLPPGAMGQLGASLNAAAPSFGAELYGNPVLDAPPFDESLLGPAVSGIPPLDAMPLDMMGAEEPKPLTPNDRTAAMQALAERAQMRAAASKDFQSFATKSAKGY